MAAASIVWAGGPGRHVVWGREGITYERVWVTIAVCARRGSVVCTPRTFVSGDQWPSWRGP